MELEEESYQFGELASQADSERAECTISLQTREGDAAVSAQGEGSADEEREESVNGEKDEICPGNERHAKV